MNVKDTQLAVRNRPHLLARKARSSETLWRNRFIPQSPLQCSSGQPAGRGGTLSAEPGPFWKEKSRTLGLRFNA